MNPDGSHIRQITHAPEGWSDDSPAWSPDGTKVAFYRGCRPSHCYGSRIMVVDVNTGDTRNAQVAGGPRRARWPTLARSLLPPSSRPGHHVVRASRELLVVRDRLGVAIVLDVGLVYRRWHKVVLAPRYEQQGSTARCLAFRG